MPERIQLRRTKGWRKPKDAVVVARPSRWGNPHVVTRQAGTRLSNGLVCPPWWKIITDVERRYYMIRTTEHEARQLAVDEYRRDLERSDPDLSPLVGRDLACWCPLDQPCHADVLLEIANAGPFRSSR